MIQYFRVYKFILNELKLKELGATESFSDIDLSLVSGKLGGMMGVANDDNKIDALYQYETIVSSHTQVIYNAQGDVVSMVTRV